MLRFLVTLDKIMTPKEFGATAVEDFFDYEECGYCNTPCLYNCEDFRYFNKGGITHVDYFGPPTGADVSQSRLVLKKDSSIETYKFYYIKNQHCRLSTQPLLYHYAGDAQFYNDDNSYYNDKKQNPTINTIKNYIADKLFNDVMQNGFEKTFLFPDSLPLIYQEKPNYTYNVCYNTTGNSNTFVKEVYNIEGKALYVIGNKNTYPDPRNIHTTKRYDKMVVQQYDFLYIPHVMYLPLGGFKYKIKSINGKPLKEFMARYVDNFKPTLIKSVNRFEPTEEWTPQP